MQHEHKMIKHHALAEPVGKTFSESPAKDEGARLKVIVCYGFVRIKNAVFNAFIIGIAVLVHIVLLCARLFVLLGQYLHFVRADREIWMGLQKMHLHFKFLRMRPVVVTFAEGHISAAYLHNAVNKILAEFRIPRLKGTDDPGVRGIAAHHLLRIVG